MKVGIITFHASHNYGSMLQAYALQTTVESLGHQSEIINLRTDRQRQIYQPLHRSFFRTDRLKALVFPMLAMKSWRKYKLFEEFLSNRLHLSEREFATYEELQSARIQYDACISGSDQIWNTSCFDFDPSYFLGFTDCSRKIAYAPSMGPEPENLDNEELGSYLRQAMTDYAAITVREKASAERMEQLTGHRPEVVLDPTLLMGADKWRELAGDRPIINGRYIFIYTPWTWRESYNEAEELSKKFGIKILLSQAGNYGTQLFNRRFRYQTATGPLEFLNLIRHADLVVGSSFHAVVFSLLLGTQVYAVGGMEDARIANLLTLTGLQRFAAKPDSLLKAAELSHLYAGALDRLQPHIDRSIDFLRNNLPQITDTQIITPPHQQTSHEVIHPFDADLRQVAFVNIALA
ncbi:MAG: polysaccharide pyruvyl transferase family protein [Bacteroides sp.]|nr:polysaccharide pyruvyl transferase family protein [Bacteroides sp.]MCM1413234.1 polysaccharide pyruvyl transferase family protein [Bacteroides sp.]MCM1471456.1 polysaccharide pyruvyl transferase family protein [Bacteroides sp.]